MDVKIQSSPTLPLELVERIVDFAGRESTETCMLVSKQFHAGALRNIYRSQAVNLKARSDVLSKKYDRLFGDEDQSLVGGSRGRHVRKLCVHIGSWPRFWDRKEPEYEEDILLCLMEAFYKRSGLQKLVILGGDEYRWGSLPPKVRQSLQTLMGSPCLSHLSLQKLHDFPIDILHGNQTLRTVNLENCGNTTNASEHAVIIPKATRLRSFNLPAIAHGLLVPRLALLTAQHSTLAERQDSWIRIERARETLRRITMFDNENACRSTIMTPALPINLKLSDFPELWYLDYTYEGRSWASAANPPLLGSITPFFETAVPVREFNDLRLRLHLDQRIWELGEGFWLERKDSVAIDRGWATLDTILASDHYPNLDDIHISLKIFNSILQQVDSEIMEDAYPHYTGEKKAIAEDIEARVLEHFVQTRARGIEVIVEVFADF